MFILDKKLQEDTFFVCDLALSTLLLMNNANYPWFILVPRQPELAELTDLDFDNQVQLLREMNLISDFLQKEYHPKKLNIAALGNVVRQLHVHVIARFEDDISFPNPVWGGKSKAYAPQDAQMLINKIIAYING